MISERTSLHSPTLRVRTSTCVHSIHVVAERVQTVLLRYSAHVHCRVIPRSLRSSARDRFATGWVQE
jgi:hypothetical protein